MKLTWKTCAKICVSVFLLYLAIAYWQPVAAGMVALVGAASPLIIGCVIAYVVNILMCFFEKHFFPNTQKKWVHNLRRPISITAAVLTLLAIVAFVIGAVVPQLVLCVQLLFAELPGTIRYLISELDKFHVLSDEVIDMLNAVDWKSRIGQIASVVTSGFGDVLNVVITTVTSVFSGLVTALISIIFAMYLLLDKNKICRQVKSVMRHYLSEKWYQKITFGTAVLNDCFHRFIVGQCTEALILGVLCIIGMMILRMPYVSMISALIAFTSIIPIAGPYIGASISAFMILTVSPIQAVIFLVFMVLLQQLEGNLIYPRVVGHSIGLPGIWVLAAVTVGGGLFGIVGMLLGVPLAATLWRLLRHDMKKNRKLSLKAILEEESK